MYIYCKLTHDQIQIKNSFPRTGARVELTISAVNYNLYTSAQIKG